MRYLLAATAALATLGMAGAVSADSYVQGYYRDNGTYVQPHYRSSPDGNAGNNYSTQGNTNPYTGQRGTVNPYNYGNSGYKAWGTPRNTYGGNGGWE